MSVVMQNVLQSALALPETERVELVDALIASLPRDEQVALDDEFLAELERRCDEVDAGAAKTFSWEEVKARVHGRLGDDA
jgi:putative addiction module component (TIGR02574 family)